MINAGAMLCGSLLDSYLDKQSHKDDNDNDNDHDDIKSFSYQLKSSNEDKKSVQNVCFQKKFQYFIQTIKDLSGCNHVAFSNQTCLSQFKRSFKNRALLHFMKAQGALKKEDNVDRILQFFLNTQAIKTNTTNLAVLAASLANGGKCPIDDNSAVFQESQTTKCILTQMLMAGLNTYSGEWGFSIGLPAKSSISGITLMVVPNLLGVCVLSPPVDSHGNSWKGIEFIKRFAICAGYSKMETIYCGSKEKIRNYTVFGAQRADRGMELMLYIAKGDISHVRAILVKQDENAQCINFKDIQGNTPLDLAERKGFHEIVKLLKRMGARNGDRKINFEAIE